MCSSDLMRGGGQPQTIMFRCPNPTEARQKAIEQAMNDARTKAQRLADLAKVKLGPVIAVSESSQPESPESRFMSFIYTMEGGKTPGKDLKTPVLQDVNLDVSISVQFAIEK